MDQNKFLERFTIYLKNIIFFKIVMYVLCIGLLFWLLNLSVAQVEQSADWLIKAEQSVHNAKTKLNAISEAHDDLASIDLLYKETAATSQQQLCNQRIKFVTDLQALSEKYQLFEPMRITMTQLFTENQNEYVGNKIKTRNYELTVNFVTSDFATMLLIVQDIYALIPKYSVLTSVHTVKAETIDPSNINNLTVNKVPSLIYTNLKIHIKTINIFADH